MVNEDSTGDVIALQHQIHLLKVVIFFFFNYMLSHINLTITFMVILGAGGALDSKTSERLSVFIIWSDDW